MNRNADGSLRASSSNAALLRAAVALAPSGVEVTLYDGLGDLPHFNPDRDGETAPAAVKDWRVRLQASDGVVFSVPEYAHSLPGVLKDALDWVVGSGEFMDKPVALFNASPRGTYAQASLTETLTAMMAKVVPEAPIALQLMGTPLNADRIAADPEMWESRQKYIPATIRGMVTGIEHTAIASPDPHRLAGWYVEHLDFAINYRSSNSQTVFVKAADGSMLEIIESNTADRQALDMKAPGLRHLAIAVSDFDVVYQRLMSKSVSFLTEPEKKGGNSLVFFTDLDGNILHLLQREKPLP